MRTWDQSWRQPSALGTGTSAFPFDQEGLHSFGAPLQNIGSHLGSQELLDPLGKGLTSLFLLLSNEEAPQGAV